MPLLEIALIAIGILLLLAAGLVGVLRDLLLIHQPQPNEEASITLDGPEESTAEPRLASALDVSGAPIPFQRTTGNGHP